MSKRDYYDVLGVSRDAAPEDIRKAYRQLAMKHHPDRNPGDKQAEERFKELRQAFDVLSEEDKRRAYDRFGQAGPAAGPATGAGDFGGLFNDFFDDFFTQQGGGAGAGGRVSGRQGADLVYEVELGLEEAAAGHKVQLRFQKMDSCGECGGSGARGKSAPRPCGACNGSGQVQMQRGFFAIRQTCGQCEGSGRIIYDPCGRCNGQGRYRQATQFEVQIPEGMDSRDQVRLAGAGEAGERGAPPGDLYVRVQVREHAFFKRRGADLLCEVPVSIVCASLGREVEVPTLKGKVMLKVPSGTQSGKELRLRGRGMPVMRSGGRHGDLLCRIQVETPVRLTERQRALLEELDQEMRGGTGHRHTPITDSWLKRAKRFLKELRGD